MISFIRGHARVPSVRHRTVVEAWIDTSRAAFLSKDTFPNRQRHTRRKSEPRSHGSSSPRRRRSSAASSIIPPLEIEDLKKSGAKRTLKLPTGCHCPTLERFSSLPPATGGEREFCRLQDAEILRAQPMGAPPPCSEQGAPRTPSTPQRVHTSWHRRLSKAAPKAMASPSGAGPHWSLVNDPIDVWDSHAPYTHHSTGDAINLPRGPCGRTGANWKDITEAANDSSPGGGQGNLYQEVEYIAGHEGLGSKGVVALAQ